MVERKSLYPIGETKPVGSSYTKCLVIPKMADEEVAWITEELGDMIDAGVLTTAIYHPDNATADLHLSRNKGHEVMTYLTYIIDNYDSSTLADVNLFMHSHRFAWHNNALLDSDAAKTIRHLSAERVTRHGYMNLRCHWDPGCPDWIWPGSRLQNIEKPEEFLLGQRWMEMFPGTNVPASLGQPCCAQFAVSKERIRAIPRATFVHLREWLLKTELSDFLTGRMFEYSWQYIFDGDATHCPSMRACYCDGFGVCFGDYKSFDYYFELGYRREQMEKELGIWQEKMDAIVLARKHKEEGLMGWEEKELEKPEVGRDAILRGLIQKTKEEMEGLLREALVRGRDPKQRAIESGREWEEGDGF